eukprot:411894-Pyramimonas_sp.AAC.1
MRERQACQGRAAAARAYARARIEEFCIADKRKAELKFQKQNLKFLEPFKEADGKASTFQFLIILRHQWYTMRHAPCMRCGSPTRERRCRRSNDGDAPHANMVMWSRPFDGH